MFTIVIGKDFVGKKSFIAQHLKLRYSEHNIFTLDTNGKLTDILEQEGLRVTKNLKEANIIVSDNNIHTLTDTELADKDQVFFILSGENINKDMVNKAEQVILFPVQNCEKVSEVLDIPVEYLRGLKHYEPITVI